MQTASSQGVAMKRVFVFATVTLLVLLFGGQGHAGFGNNNGWTNTRPPDAEQQRNIQCAVDKFLEELYDEDTFEGDDKENKAPATDSSHPGPFGDWGDQDMEDIVECAENESEDPQVTCVGTPPAGVAGATNTLTGGTNINSWYATAPSATERPNPNPPPDTVPYPPAFRLMAKMRLAGLMLHEWMHQKQAPGTRFYEGEGDAYHEEFIYWCNVVEMFEEVLARPAGTSIDSVNDSLADFAREHGLTDADFREALEEAQIKKAERFDSYRSCVFAIQRMQEEQREIRQFQEEKVFHTAVVETPDIEYVRTDPEGQGPIVMGTLRGQRPVTYMTGLAIVTYFVPQTLPGGEQALYIVGFVLQQQQIVGRVCGSTVIEGVAGRLDRAA